MENGWKNATYSGKIIDWIIVCKDGTVKNKETGYIYKPIHIQYDGYSVLRIEAVYKEEKYEFVLPHLIYYTFSGIELSHRYIFEYKDGDYCNCSFDNLIPPIGKRIMSKHGYVMECIGYKSNQNVIVRFDDGQIKSTNWSNFINGTVSHPLYPSRWTK